MGREGHRKQTPLACVGSACSGWTTLGLPQPKAACTSWVHPAQAPGCSARALSQVGPAFCALPRSRLLRFWGALQWHRPRWAVSFVPFPALSDSGNWVLGECTVPGGPCILCTPRSWPLGFLGALWRPQVSYVSPLGSWPQVVTLLADVNCPGSQEDMISNWEPAQFDRRCSLWGQDCSSPLPSGSGCHTAASLALGREGPKWQLACSHLVVAQSFVLWAHQGSSCGIRAFHRKGFFLFFSSL